MHGRDRLWFQLHTRRSNHVRRSRLECREAVSTSLSACKTGNTDRSNSLDVGGKLLTNQLKELVSFRQWNMMDETYIMNHVKETCCYVSTQFGKDLDICQ